MADVPPPLPPNRPNSRQRTKHSSPYSFNQPRPSPTPATPPPHPYVSPKHSWAPTESVPSIERFSPAPNDDEAPPPVPTSARPSIPKSPSWQNNLSSSLSSSVTLFPHPDDKFSLTQLVDSYSGLFPLKICVVKGFYGDRGESSAIAVDEMYNFHFVKRTKVVSINDVAGNKYVIPLNSATKFGLLYEEGIAEFGTVEDILNAKITPRVVCARTGYVGNNDSSSVSRHEVLIVKSVEKGRFRRKPGSIKVYSVTKNMEKTLSKDVFGKFTTDPFNTQMYLPEFTKYIKDPIPCKARMYLDFESDEPLPDFLTSEAITMSRLYVETSVIASPLNDDGSIQDEEESETVDIPISLDIEVSVIPPADEEDDDYEKLTEDTMNLLTRFDPSSSGTRHIEVDYENDYAYTAQTQIFKSVRKGFESEGLNIETPKKVRSFSQRQQLPQVPRERSRERSVVSPASSVDQEGYEDMTQLDLARPENEEAPPPLRGKPPTPPPLYYPPAASDERPSPPPSPPPDHTPPPPPPVKSKKQLAFSPSLPPVLNKTATIPPRTRHRPATADSMNSQEERTRYFERPSLDKPLPLPTDKETTQGKNTSAKPPPPVHVRKQSSTDDDSSRTDNARTVPGRRAKPKPTGKIFPTVPPPPPEDNQSPHQEKNSDFKTLNTSLEALSSRVQSLEEDSEGTVTRDDLSSINEEMKGIRASIEENMKLTVKLQNEVASMQGELQRLRQQGGGGGSPDAGRDGEMNAAAQELEELDCAQVQKLLELMGMSKYQKMFMEAEIDGSLLLECDDKTLKEDLEVSSKLDRLKLLQLTSGRKSVRSIFQKAYVTFEPRN